MSESERGPGPDYTPPSLARSAAGRTHRRMEIAVSNVDLAVSAVSERPAAQSFSFVLRFLPTHNCRAAALLVNIIGKISTGFLEELFDRFVLLLPSLLLHPISHAQLPILIATSHLATSRNS